MATVTKNRARVFTTSAFLFLLAMLLTAYSSRHPWTRSAGAQVVSLLLRPLQVTSSGVQSFIGDSWRHYIALVGVSRENEELRERLMRLEGVAARAEEVERELAKMRELLAVPLEEDWGRLAARVIGYSPAAWIKSITINVGLAGGVSSGDPVVTEAGIVGQVVGVGLYSSEVLLITDPSSGVDAFVQSTRSRGVLEGAGDRCKIEGVGDRCKLDGESDRCKLQFVVDERVQIGDRIISSGMDGVYPAGLPLGVVTKVGAKSRGIFLPVTVEPTVKLDRLEHVLVLMRGVPKKSAEVRKPK